MVYRGKPSAGCESCRKAKKRCTLEQPACVRCVKLKKPCLGYRDTGQLQIQDESEAVRLKVSRTARRTTAALAATAADRSIAPSRGSTSVIGDTLAPTSTRADSFGSSSDDTSHMCWYDPPADTESSLMQTGQFLAAGGGWSAPCGAFTRCIKPRADDVATTHFFNQFTSAGGHWDFIRNLARDPKMDPCLGLAIRACGMAALDNVENVAIGRHYSRTMYAEALGLLNAALRDPKRCRSDEALIAVAMLGYYENLTCDSKESIESWKAHISGATQLLKMRGKAQFKSQVGRLLYRETRAQILIHCIWDDLEPPAFLSDWDDELAVQSGPMAALLAPADELSKISFDFSVVRARIEKGTISDTEAADACTKLDQSLISWSANNMKSKFWRYGEVDVPDSPEVWNGMVHAYVAFPSPSVWNTFRSIRILVSRTQEYLCGRFPFTPVEREEQTRYFHRVRRQMTDEICAGIPCSLGNAPAGVYNSPTVLLSAYGSIWPLFFAGTCALERVSSAEWLQMHATASQHCPPTEPLTTSAPSAQVSWIWSQLRHISSNIGLKWASGIAAVLRGDFRLHGDLLPGGDAVQPPILTKSWAERDEEQRNSTKLFHVPRHDADRSSRQPPWLGRQVRDDLKVGPMASFV